MHVNSILQRILFPTLYSAAFCKSTVKLIPCKLTVMVDFKNSSYFWLKVRPWVEWKTAASDPKSTLLVWVRTNFSAWYLFPHSWNGDSHCCLSLSRGWLSVAPWTAARQASLSFTVSQSLLKLISIESVMPSNHLILCHPLLLLPSIFPSIRVFSNESAVGIRWPKYWNFSFSISPSNEDPGLISLSIDWLDLLAVQGTLKSLLQHHSSKASILWLSAFFMVQLS